MTITLLTCIQHGLSISSALREEKPSIIGYSDPHPASLGCMAVVRLATVTRSSNRSGNNWNLGLLWEYMALILCVEAV